MITPGESGKLSDTHVVPNYSRRTQTKQVGKNWYISIFQSENINELYIYLHELRTYLRDGFARLPFGPFPIMISGSAPPVPGLQGVAPPGVYVGRRLNGTCSRRRGTRR